MANEADLSGHTRGLGFILNEWEATGVSLKGLLFLLNLALLDAKMLNFW